MSARRSPRRSATRSCRSPTSRRRTPSNAPGSPGRRTAPNPDLARAGAKASPPPTVLVTSAPALMRGADRQPPRDRRARRSSSSTRELATPVKGTGDLLAALLLARRLEGPRLAEGGGDGAFERLRDRRRHGEGRRRRTDARRSCRTRSPTRTRRSTSGGCGAQTAPCPVRDTRHCISSKHLRRARLSELQSESGSIAAQRMILPARSSLAGLHPFAVVGGT